MEWVEPRSYLVLKVVPRSMGKEGKDTRVYFSQLGRERVRAVDDRLESEVLLCEDGEVPGGEVELDMLSGVLLKGGFSGREECRCTRWKICKSCRLGGTVRWFKADRFVGLYPHEEFEWFHGISDAVGRIVVRKKECIWLLCK